MSSYLIVSALKVFIPYLEIITLFIFYLSFLQIFIVYLPLEFILFQILYLIEQPRLYSKYLLYPYNSSALWGLLSPLLY